ncbi:MAG: DnaJ C-terminal domain-containing protein [Acidobacteriota bacterium]|jgi:molecular chaperone DnaJ
MGGAGGFSDLFDTLFTAGGATRPSGPQRGDDLVFPATIPLKDAFAGRKITLTVPHTVSCASCKGFGHTSSGAGKPCKRCGGSGKLGLMRGPFSFAQACPACGGTGKDPGDRCAQCGGTGFTETRDKVAVKIPAGVDTGSRVRVKGKGQAGLRGGPPGDLYIETHVEPDPVFKREGPHLKIQAPISYAEAVLGAKIEIPTMTGTARLRIPPGTGCGQVFRLKERGMPSLRGGTPGDLLVEVTVSVPGVVDEKSKDLLREFARLNPENPRSYYNSAQR